MTKLFAEYLKEADDNPANIIMSVAELIRKDMDADNKVAKTSVPFFLMQLRNAGLPISYSGLKAYYNAHPELKNVIQTFNDEDIIFVGQGDEADGETLGEPQGDIPPEEVVDNMAKRAMNKRMNELDDNMIEGKDKGASKEEEDEFHVALDDLVHKTFGHSSMEKKKKMEDNAMPTHVPSGKFKGDKIIVGKEVGLSPFNYHATVDSYDYADDTGANSPVGHGKTPEEAVEDLLDQLDELDEEVINEKLSQEEQEVLDELIEDYIYAVIGYYDNDGSYPYPDDILKIIRQEYGDKIADQVDQWETKILDKGYKFSSADKGRNPTRITKSGMANKTDINTLKNSLKNKLRDKVGPKGPLPEEFDYWQSPSSLAKLAGISERKLSKSEEGKREKYVKGMKKAKADFKDRYGKDAESVMYATATKMAKGGK